MNYLQPKRRVAFIGASGTGKTSIISLLPHVKSLPSRSREVAVLMGFKTPYEVDAAGKRSEFQERLLTDKIFTESVTDEFITDRSVVDVLTYYAIHDPISVREDLIQETKLALRRYTHVFLCPIDVHSAPATDPPPRRQQAN